MPRLALTKLPQFIAAIALCFITTAGTASAAGCENNEPCDRCARASEFSWNPDNQYVTPRLSRFYEISDELKAAYERKDAAALAKLAQENLELAAVYRCNWNYGNAIHDTNRYLGLASLREGKIDEAAKYLALAGKSTGSPQLNSFGPDLDLANQLLKQGKVEEVKAYLVGVKHFWELDQNQIDGWLAAIERGEKPELDRFAAFRPGIWTMVLIALVMALPLIATMGLWYAGRNVLREKARFVAIALVGGYAALFGLEVGSRLLLLQLPTPDFTSRSSIWLMSYLPALLTIVVPLIVVVVIYKRFSKPAVATR